jgi:outer membrane protein assembly factor BamB
MSMSVRAHLTALSSVFVAALLWVAACGSSPPSAPAPTEHTITATATAAGSTVTDQDWPTYHRDNARTGVANISPVNRITAGWTAQLDGAVYGQPLVVAGEVLAATENNTVYALDPANGSVRWSTHLGTPMPRGDLPCGNIDPLGITSTMAYDAASGIVFAVAESTGAHHTLYGLDARTGRVALTRAAEPPHGQPIAHQQRSALTVLNGRVYVAYGGLAGDCGPYIGAVVSVPIVGHEPIASYAIPTTREGGIWSPGGGTVANGQLLYAVGNGESIQGGYDGSDSILALRPDLTLADRFAPDTWAEDNAADLDLGSMTPAVVSGHAFVAGKRGVGYTVRLDHLGGLGGEVAQAPVCTAYGGSAVSGDTVYLPCSDGTRAVRVSGDGSITVLWQAPVHAAGSPVLGGGAVWVVDYDGGVLYLLDPGSGAVRQQLALSTMPHFTSPTVVAGHAFIGTMTGVAAVTIS